jgi:hypothetical protein
MIGTPVKGITAAVLRPADGGDFTLGGVSSGHARLTITGIVSAAKPYRAPLPTAPRTCQWAWEPLPAMSRVFEPREDAPEAWLYLRRLGHGDVWAVVPACAARTGQALEGWLTRLMFGSNFVHLGDSRLSEIVGFYGAVAIHDRIEAGR